MSERAVDQQRTDDGAVSALTDLIRWLTGELVDDAEQATISADRRGNHVAMRLELPEQQLGQVIGRGGRIARALRTALMVAGSRHDVRVSLDIESIQAHDANA